MRWIGVVLVSLVMACTTLKEDPSIPASLAGFPSAEGIVHGERFRGVKVVSIKRGQPLSSLDFRVQTLFSGNVRIDSDQCSISESISYDGSTVMPVELSGVAEENCVVAFTVSPEYKGQQSQPVSVYSFTGKLFIRVIDDEAWMGSHHVLRASGDGVLTIDLAGEMNPVRLFLTGCGIDFNQKLSSPDGVIEVPLSEFSVQEQGTCVASGVLISPEFQDLLIDVVIVRHSDSFLDLPKPAVTFEGQRVCVQADSSVSFLMSDDIVSNKNKKCFKNPTLIRGITVKGRSFVGEVKGGSIEWK